MPQGQLEVASSLDLDVAADEEINIDALFDPKGDAPAGPEFTEDGEIILADSEPEPEPEPELDDEGNPIIVPTKDGAPDPVETPAVDSEYVPGAYIGQINDEYELGLHMENLPKDLTPQGEMDLVKQVLDKRRSENEAATQALTTYDKLIQSDAETQQYLKDRAAGLSMKDMVAKYSTSAAYTNEDMQVIESMQKALGLDAEQAEAAVEQMKTAGTYEARRKQIVEHNIQAETQRALEEQERVRQEDLAEVAAWDAQKADIQAYLSKTDAFGDFKLDNSIKKDLYNTVTLIDKEGLTQLDRDVQSTENSIKAALAIKYWAQIEKAIKSVGINKGKASAFDLLHTDPQELQKSSSQKSKQVNGIDLELANML